MKKYMYMGLPLIGVLFYLVYIHIAAIDMVYSDYIRLINSYLPDVWNPDKFWVPDLLTRIPANYLERGINVRFFGYSVTFDRIMGILGFGAAALMIGGYCRKKRIGAGWYMALIVFMFSLNKWEMLYNGTGWAHFLAFAFFYYTYLVLDRVYEGKAQRGDFVRLLLLPAVTTIGVAGPYCAIYSMTLLLAYLFLLVRNLLFAGHDLRSIGFGGKRRTAGTGGSRYGCCPLSGKQICLLAAFVIWPLLAYLWSNSQAVYEYSGSVDTPLLTAFFQEPKFFLKFFLKSFASMVFGVELIGRHMAEAPGKVWCALGLLVLAAYFLALWMNFYYGIAERTIFPLMLLAGGGMNHLLVLVSRYIFMSNDAYGMSSRYALQYQVGILGIFLTFALAAQCGFRRAKKAELTSEDGRQSREKELASENGRRPGQEKTAPESGRLSALMRWTAVLLTAVFVLGNLATTAEEFSFAKYRKEHNLEVKEIALNFENETDETLQTALEYHKSGIREALTILKERGWNIYKEE